MKQPNHQPSGSFAMSAVHNSRVGNGAWGTLSGFDSHQASSDATLFSSSLPVFRHEKLNLNDSEHACQSVDDASADLNKLQQNVEGSDLLVHVESQGIGSLLPDDDELLAGIMDFDLSGLPGSLDDLEDYDLFGSGGGMELESDLHDSLSMGMSKISLSDGVAGNGMLQHGLANGAGALAGEHPYGEHPSRTLFVRNINSNVEDTELKALFEQYGDIRTLYTACKHRGFVMISYYDIRAARTAMRALQNKALRRRKLDIHFSIPKDNPSDKDMNQGTLVVFNLDPSVSNEDLRHICEAYGEVKEVRETPHKRHHKFIEFYDVRAAEAALKSLNRSDIAGKRIKLEPSRPGGSRRNMLLHLNQDFDQDETRTFLHYAGSPSTNSPPANWAHFNNPVEHNHLQDISKSPGFRTMSPTTKNNLPGLASVLHTQASAKVAPIGKDHIMSSHLENMFANTNSGHGVSFQHPHSLPEPKVDMYHGTVPSFGPTPNGSGMDKLSGPQFLWGSPNPHSDRSNFSAWSTPPVGHSLMTHGFPYSGRTGSFIGSSHHHHVGSAPSGVHIERQFGYLPESPETSFIGSMGFGSRGLGHNGGSFMMNMGARAAISSGVGNPGNMSENGSSSFRMMSSPRLSPAFLGNGQYHRLTPISMEGLTDHGRSSRRIENSGNQADSKKQFQLDLDKIIRGEDTRTTLMIKNIPNKYTSKMLLASIDENHQGTYDFLYLPIDFKNKCNVGYAFINMLSPKHIIPFYKAFNGKKWEKFNSEKVASLAYGRIQGKVALVTHFQNSSLMNEDKRCRPILFHSEGLEASDQIIPGHLTSGSLNIHVRQPQGSFFGESPEIPRNGENC